jgi:hypothetical protein
LARTQAAITGGCFSSQSGRSDSVTTHRGRGGRSGDFVKRLAGESLDIG